MYVLCWVSKFPAAVLLFCDLISPKLGNNRNTVHMLAEYFSTSICTKLSLLAGCQ